MEGWAALQPFATLVAAPQTGEPGSISLHLLHRYAAFGTLLVLGAAALQALGDDEQRRKAALLLLLLLTAEIILGVATVLSGFTLWLAIGQVLISRGNEISSTT